MNPEKGSTQLLSARDTAVRLGVAERTVRRWIESGELSATKERSRFWIDQADADVALSRSRASRSVEQAEWRGRYLEVKERLAVVEAELAEERARRIRFERVLYPLQIEENGVVIESWRWSQ